MFVERYLVVGGCFPFLDAIVIVTLVMAWFS